MVNGPTAVGQECDDEDSLCSSLSSSIYESSSSSALHPSQELETPPSEPHATGIPPFIAPLRSSSTPPEDTLEIGPDLVLEFQKIQNNAIPKPITEPPKPPPFSGQPSKYDPLHPPMYSQTSPVYFNSRHMGYITACLSRYKRQWFLTYGRAYGMAEGRIVCKLNRSEESHPFDNWDPTKFFWINSNFQHEPYYQHDTKVHLSSPIHMLLDCEPPIARLTGRQKAEQSNYNGKAISCYEVEILMPQSGLLRQCYHCLDFEDASEPRYKMLEQDMYWCHHCRLQGATLQQKGKGTWSMTFRDVVQPRLFGGNILRHNIYQR